MSAYTPPAYGWRTFLILWVTQSLSLFGSALTGFAITIWLTTELYPLESQKGELAVALSLMGLAWGIPQIFGAPIAGAWADRHDRKRTMIVADILSGLMTVAIIALMLLGMLQLWTLLILFVPGAFFNAFHSAAFDTSYAMLVPEEKLPRANGMMQTIWSLSSILSPAVAAIIISLPALARQGQAGGPLGMFLAGLESGVPLALSVDAITFIIASATTWFLHIPSPQRTDLRDETGKVTKSIWADIREGAHYIWLRRTLIWLLGTFTVANFVGGTMGVLMPLLVRFNYSGDWAARGFTFESALALLSTAASVGGVAGGVAISAWGGLKRRRVFGVLVPMIIAAFAQIIMGFSPWLFVAAAMLFVVDGMIPFMNAHSQTIWQTQVPRELQGRVFSVRRLIAQFTAPVGVLIAGVLGGLLNPGIAVAALGLLMLVFCVAQLFNPYMLRVEDREWIEARAAEAVGSMHDA